MKKKLTLDETWKLCLKMWKWIAETAKSWEPVEEDVVEALKDAWLAQNWMGSKLDHDCFFCEYDEQRKHGCQSCPAKKVDRSFYCNQPYSNELCFWMRPVQFYAKLKQLNRKRLAKKRKQ